MTAETISQREGVPPDVRSYLYAAAFLRQWQPRAPEPKVPFFYREPGVWVPYSCAIAVGNRASDGAASADPTNVSIANSAVSPMFVGVIWSGTQTITSVNWNTSESFGAALGQGTIGSGLVTQAALYALKNPTTGTHNVTVDYSGAPGGGGAVYVITTTGGDTTTGWRSIFTRTEASGTNSSQTLTDSVSGDLVFHAATVFASSFTFAAGETNTSTQNNNIAGSGFSGGLSTKTAAGASETVGVGTQSFYGEVSTCAIPSGGGGATRGLFRTPAVNGLGVGGSFYRDPLAAPFRMAQRAA